MMGLTRRQADAHAALYANPDITFRELATAIGARSHGHAQVVVKVLVDRGYVRKHPLLHRSFEVLVPPRNGRLVAPIPPARFGTDPTAGRPGAYTGPYPIRSHRTMAQIMAEEA